MSNLDFDTIEISQDLDFFGGDVGSIVDKEDSEEKEKEQDTEVEVGELFAGSPESVGDGDDKNSEGTREGTSDSDEDGSTSPQNTVFSSIAAALKEEGVLPDVADEDIQKVIDAEKLIEAMRKQMEHSMSERERRINEALENNVEVPVIRQYEELLSQLDNVSAEQLEEEGAEGEDLRRRIILQDYINKGFSKEKAEKKTERSFSAGTDVEDAKDALEGNKEFFKGKYDELIKEAKERTEEAHKEQQKLLDDLEKKIMNTEEPFEGVKLDKATRKKVFDAINKPAYKDKDGNVYNKIQKYQMDNREDYIYKLGVIFTLTDGFKDLSGLIKTRVEKEKKKSIRELEHVVNNTNTHSDGSLKFMSGVSSDKNSYSGLTLNI